MWTTFPPATPDAATLSRGGLLPADTTGSRADQLRSVLSGMESALGEAGMDFRHVVRTWFHLDHILDWYGEFNAVRTAFFRERGVFGGVVPASTGVGIANAKGAALVGGFLAVKPVTGRARVEAVASPLQCPALDYESSFSRAVEVEIPGRRHLLVSGTASIAPGGASAFQGDVDGQIRLTMDVVAAILESRGLAWNDTVRAVAYFVDLENAPRLDAHLRSRGLLGLPIEPVEATICREDLLFELELEAVRLCGA